MSLMDSWPYEAPRVEFLLSGFADEKHIFCFEKVAIKQTLYTNGVRSVEDVEWAKCNRCDTKLHPERENLREHGRLHLAVELATRAILKQLVPDLMETVPLDRNKWGGILQKLIATDA